VFVLKLEILSSLYLSRCDTYVSESPLYADSFYKMELNENVYRLARCIYPGAILMSVSHRCMQTVSTKWN